MREYVSSVFTSMVPNTTCHWLGCSINWWSREWMSEQKWEVWGLEVLGELGCPPWSLCSAGWNGDGSFVARCYKDSIDGEVLTAASRTEYQPATLLSDHSVLFQVKILCFIQYWHFVLEFLFLRDIKGGENRYLKIFVFLIFSHLLNISRMFSFK